MTNKTRCTIYLTAEQDSRSKRLAELMGISRNAVVQQAVAQYLMTFKMLEDKVDELSDNLKGQLQIDLDGIIRDENGKAV